jgi:hypothetical protein
MSRVWQLQEAKNKFSEVVEEAMAHGPQVITNKLSQNSAAARRTERRYQIKAHASLSSPR